MSVKVEIYIMLLCVSVSASPGVAAAGVPSIGKGSDMEIVDLWELANEKKDILRFSTLFTAQNVRDLLSDQAGLKKAVEWCEQTAVTHVYIESFRNGYTAERAVLERAKEAFVNAGIDVSGCVTTTQVGKSSTGWKIIDCYTDIPTQEHLQDIFEYTASLFDEIMIDDFLFTDCECEECRAARGDRNWAEYRSDLMVQVSRERILKPAKAKNPNVKIIIKYPQWYDNFHNRGYEVVRETREFDKIWVGTETRDPDNQRWGRKAQYEAYFIMRWLGDIGGEKTGGGWFDPYGTSPPTYVEQARQTVLADAKEALLFCYGSLLRDTGPANVEKLRTEIPALFELAEIVRGKPIKGVLAPKVPNSEPHNEEYVFDFVGMLGLPLVPKAEIINAEAVLLSVHALKDQQLVPKLKQMMDAGTPLLVTDGLRDRLGDQIALEADNIQILRVSGEPRSLLKMDRASLLNLRKKMLKPFGITFDAPNKVSLYLIGDDHIVIENFNDEGVDVRFCVSGLKSAEALVTLPVDSKINLKLEGDELNASMSSRSMVAIQISK
jgi:hypothetical protein